jgi:hypothetical protein
MSIMALALHWRFLDGLKRGFFQPVLIDAVL